MMNFKNLRIWQLGFEIAVKCYELVKVFPTSERFGISSQITRAAVSIPSNIAEGSGRMSKKEYLRFMEISLGSSFELETQLLISQAVSYGDSSLIHQILRTLDSEQRMIINFMKTLRN